MEFNRCTFFVTSLFLVLSPLADPTPNTIGPISAIINIAQDDCEQAFQQLSDDDDWIEQLINPNYTTQEEISERLDLYSRVYKCLDNNAESLPDELIAIRTLAEYFLIFAGGFQAPYEETTLALVDFTEIDDPAIVKIRDEAGVFPPEGYIYVRFYSSRDAMPGIVRQAFESEEVAGVTMLMRYVAILNEEKETWPQQALQSQTLPETISHELIHAYVNAILGTDGMDFPKWYHEGIAVYFSGSGENHSVVTPDFTVSTTSPEEYKQYDINFKYLETQLGHERLLELIRKSIQGADPSMLYQDLGISSEQTLVARASAWEQRRVRTRLGIGIFVAIVFVLGLLRLMPETKCSHCGYVGKFDHGYCPRCHRR